MKNQNFDSTVEQQAAGVGWTFDILVHGILMQLV